MNPGPDHGEHEAAPPPEQDLPGDEHAGRGRFRAVLVLLLALATTLMVWLNARGDLHQRAQTRFETRTSEIVEEIRAHLSAYETVLHGAAGLLHASDEVAAREWREYVQTLDLERNFPGILGVGFAPYVAHPELPRFLARVRAMGLRGFRLTPEGRRDHYAPVLFIAPWHWRNQRAFGYDMYSEPTRRAAMEHARDTGRPTLSGPVTLRQETRQDIQTGILMYRPVYAGGRVPETLEERRARLLGFTYSPYRMRQMMEGILGPRLFQRRVRDLHLQVFDGASPAGRLLFETEQGQEAAAVRHLPAYTSVTRIDAVGRTWALRFTSLPSFEQTVDLSAPRLYLGAGLAISLLLFAISWSLATLRERAVRLAQRMTLALREERTQLREITATLGEGLYVLDDAGRINFVNPAAERLLNRPREQLLGELGRRYLDVPLPRLGQRSGEAELYRHGGEVIPVTYVVTPLRHNQHPGGAVVAFNDIRDRKRAEAALRESEQFQKLFRYSADALFLLDLEGHIIDANRLACESLGWPREELVGGLADRFVLWSSQPRPGQELRDFFEQVRRGIVVGESEYVHRDGRRFRVETTYSAITHGGRDMLLVSARDVTARKEAERRMNDALAELEHSRQQVEEINRKLAESNRELDRLSRRDGLTGIANRRHFDEYLELEWHRAARDHQPLSLLLVDVDHFKAYNDRYGHQAGDDCLRRIAETLDGQLARSIDMVARYGGEEFAVVLPETPPAGALNLAERMREGVRQQRIPHDHSQVAPWVTISLGTATLIPDSSRSTEGLLAAADKALYQAKQQGRDRVVSATGPNLSEA